MKVSRVTCGEHPSSVRSVRGTMWGRERRLWAPACHADTAHRGQHPHCQSGPWRCAQGSGLKAKDREAYEEAVLWVRGPADGLERGLGGCHSAQAWQENHRSLPLNWCLIADPVLGPPCPLQERGSRRPWRITLPRP